MNKKNFIIFLKESKKEFFYEEDLCKITLWDKEKVRAFFDYDNRDKLPKKVNEKWTRQKEYWQFGKKLSRYESSEIHMNNLGNLLKRDRKEVLPQGVEIRYRLYNLEYVSMERDLDLELVQLLGHKIKFKHHFHEREYSSWGAWTYVKNGYREEIPNFHNNLNEIISLLKENNINYKSELKDGIHTVFIHDKVSLNESYSKALVLAYINYLKAQLNHD